MVFYLYLFLLARILSALNLRSFNQKKAFFKINLSYSKFSSNSKDPEVLKEL